MPDATASSTLSTLAWRPQRFGRRNARKITDPLVEPLWDGLRVLVELRPGAPPIVVDEDGAEVPPDEGVDPVFAALPRAPAAESAVLDGYLTRRATRRGEGITIDAPQTMSSADMIGHFLIGGMAQGAAKERLDEARKAREAPESSAPESPIAFVAVDILMLDGETVLDVPLLERKRVLASVLREGPLVRVTPYVRLPIDTWILSWRAAGFREAAYKGANSRYEPGSANDEWAKATLPMQ